MNRSALQPNHHANPAKTAESSTRPASSAISQTATGAASSFFACLIGGDGTPATAGCAGIVGAGGGAAVGAACVVVAGAGVGVDGVGAGAGVVAAGAGAAFLPQSAFRSRADCSASRNDGAYCSTSGGVCRSAFPSCLSEKRQGLIVPVRLYSR